MLSNCSKSDIHVFIHSFYVHFQSYICSPSCYIRFCICIFLFSAFVSDLIWVSLRTSLWNQWRHSVVSVSLPESVSLFICLPLLVLPFIVTEKSDCDLTLSVISEITILNKLLDMIEVMLLILWFFSQFISLSVPSKDMYIAL